jgi:uncharacterized protein (TIGR02996 family)
MPTDPKSPSYVLAARVARSRNARSLALVARDVLTKVGLAPHTTVAALHDTGQGVTPDTMSVVTRPGVNPQAAAYAAAWYGLVANRPSVLAFTPQQGGPHAVYRIDAPSAKAGELRSALDAHGIGQRVLVPVGKGFHAYVFDQDGSLRDRVAAFSARTGFAVGVSQGTGQVVGHADPAKAREALRRVTRATESGRPQRMARTDLAARVEGFVRDAGPGGASRTALTRATRIPASDLRVALAGLVSAGRVREGVRLSALSARGYGDQSRVVVRQPLPHYVHADHPAPEPFDLAAWNAERRRLRAATGLRSKRKVRGESRQLARRGGVRRYQSHEEFVRAIHDEPLASDGVNPQPSLVYADWLDEQGDTLGRLIRADHDQSGQNPHRHEYNARSIGLVSDRGSPSLRVHAVVLHNSPDDRSVRIRADLFHPDTGRFVRDYVAKFTPHDALDVVKGLGLSDDTDRKSGLPHERLEGHLKNAGLLDRPRPLARSGQARRYNHEPFLNAIADNPADPRPHLVWADQLEQAGHPLGPLVRAAAENTDPGGDRKKPDGWAVRSQATGGVLGDIAGSRDMQWRHLAEPVTGARLGEHAGLRVFFLTGRDSTPSDPVQLELHPPGQSWVYQAHMPPHEALAVARRLGRGPLMAANRALAERHPEQRLYRGVQGYIVGQARMGHLTGDERSVDDLERSAYGTGREIDPAHYLANELMHPWPHDEGHFVRTHDAVMARVEEWLRRGGLRRALAGGPNRRRLARGGAVRRYNLQPFLNAIAAEPHNPNPHLVLADKLEEMGHPLGPVIRSSAVNMGRTLMPGVIREPLGRYLHTPDDAYETGVNLGQTARSQRQFAGHYVIAASSRHGGSEPDDLVHIMPVPAEHGARAWHYDTTMTPKDAQHFARRLGGDAALRMLNRHLIARSPELALEHAIRRGLAQSAYHGDLPPDSLGSLADVERHYTLFANNDALQLTLARMHMPEDERHARVVYPTEGYHKAVRNIRSRLDAWIKRGGLRQARRRGGN